MPKRGGARSSWALLLGFVAPMGCSLEEFEAELHGPGFKPPAPPDPALICQNGIWDHGEESVDCGGPCPPCGGCGDGFCDSNLETALSCSLDCGGFGTTICGNSSCEAGETADSCPLDCGSVGTTICGDGLCTEGRESIENCAIDCSGPSCSGQLGRSWDCCKPHCGWSDNTPEFSPLSSCDLQNQGLAADYDAASACDGGDAYTCHSLSPWAVSPELAYGFAATSSGDVCGRCYQIAFSGASANAEQDAGSQMIAGKQMIVQALNVGSGFAAGQFELLVPGGGAGGSGACTAQWNVADPSLLGPEDGGFLSACQLETGSAENTTLKQCVQNRCDSVFAAWPELHAGCQWFIDWLHVADQPAITYREVECPQALVDASGMDRRLLSDVSTTCN